MNVLNLSIDVRNAVVQHDRIITFMASSFACDRDVLLALLEHTASQPNEPHETEFLRAVIKFVKEDQP